jgi:DNA-binding transcriptional ArsR family regulator
MTVDVFAAVADPTRRQVLDLLRVRERAAGELSGSFPGLSQPAMSQHLRVLREAGLVTVRPDSQRRIYSLRSEGFAELDAWLSEYREFWATRLDSLAAYLDSAKPSRPRPRAKRRPT